MSGAGDAVPLLPPEELAQVRTAAEEAQRWAEWLRSQEGREWMAQEVEAARKMVEEFEMEIAAGKYALSPAELDQLRRDAEAFAEEVRTGKYNLSHDEMKELFDRGRLVKCHTIKGE